MSTNTTNEEEDPGKIPTTTTRTTSDEVEEGGTDGGDDVAGVEGDGAGAESSVPAPEEESTATFEPVVKLDEVEVTSGEEEEEVVYAQRSKLYIFGETMLNKGTGNKTWIERGVGLMRILRHKAHNKLRLLMRQEKTMKVICNHIIDPQIQLVPHVQSDRSWIWVAYDFSDTTELVETTFCIKFGDSDLAQAFHDQFLECQAKMKILLAGGSTSAAETTDPEAEKAANDAADALAGLSTQD